MTPGTIEAHGAKQGRFDVTLFCPADGGEKEDLLEQTTRDAFQCGDCSTLLIKGRFASEEKPAGDP